MNEHILVLAGASASGKTTIAPLLEQCIEGAKRIITCTTREPRPGEIDGKDYRFLTEPDFLRRLSCGEFAEHAPVLRNLYGTLREDIERQTNRGEVAILIVDIQGAETISRNYPGAQVFFVTAPIDQLLQRLDKRVMSDKSRADRKAGLKEELLGVMHHCVRYVINNEDGRLDEAVETIREIAMKNIRGN